MHFVKFISRYWYLIPFDSIVTLIISSILFLDFWLLLYRNTIDFLILISYHAALLNSFINSNRLVGVDSLVFSRPKIMACHLQVGISFVLSRPLAFCFCFFLYWLHPFSILLSRGGTVNTLVLFLIWWENIRSDVFW